MIPTITITVLLLASSLPVDVATLDGQQLSGDVQSLSNTEIVLTVDGEPRTFALKELKELTPSETSVTTTTAPSAPALRLHDGSVLTPSTISAANQQFVLVDDKLGEMMVPKASVQSLRLALLDSKIASAWEELLQRDTRDDLVVIRKGDALDHVGGVVSTIGETSISVLIDGRAVDLPRQRVFGVIYAGSETKGVEPLCLIELTDGQRLAATEIRLDNDAFVIKTVGENVLTVGASDVSRIDFSLGKIEYLTAMEPVSVTYPVDHPLFLEEVWKYRSGRNSRGKPLTLGSQQYDNGLWMHSGTVLRYRLGRQYRRFHCLMGIDGDLGACMPQVGLEIRGDGRVLFESQVARDDDPRELDLEVADVRELEIEVTSTDTNGICEHLDLVEARLIK
ncbi:MAG: NPCBM/NEW2 domain-containing protein [Planctomycetaceae bacterium]